MNETLRRKITLLPDSPGCYLMKHEGEIIYVGKAVNLKNRVRSYFQGRDHTPKVASMVRNIDDFDIVLCRTNLEALILECNLIKLHKPYYNILLKDDKQYPYIRVDLNDPYPRLTLARKVQQDGARYFGPYTGAGAVRDVLESVKKLFPLRTCSQALPAKKEVRPCVNYEIGRCLGPCAGKCTPEEYREAVNRAVAFLSGDQQTIIHALNEEMLSASRAYQYERAAVLRDRIRDIENLAQRQQASQIRRSDQDVIALAHDDADAMAYVLSIRDGKIIEGKQYALPHEGAEPVGEVLFDFLVQYYDRHEPPRELLIEELPGEVLEDVTEYLRQKRQGACDVTVPQRGAKKGLILMCRKNAADALTKQNARKQIHYDRTVGACHDLATALGLDIYPRRIEGYDISNTQGTLSVASMVVFIDGEPAVKEYRRYRIKTVVGANDFASLNEVLERRFKRALSDDPETKWPMPDLILIDGGPEQLAFSLRAMRDLGADVPMFGLAKKREEIYLPERPDPVILDHHTYALHLIQRVRDESHRFAITFHRSLRTKDTIRSSLESIPGIGPQKRKALLKAFGSLKAVREADENALNKVKGISERNAADIFRALHDGSDKEDEQGNE
ncbi:MAG: excinuclease ABC subunit UvrC [Clostridia bacterium]|nr:excinuclease ABC subunit UvrC [Clostridia bacterium]